MDWPASLPVVQVRVARPTDRLDEIVRFYRDGLGLPVIGGFTDHDGYTGVMLGLPDLDYHLEFTTHIDGSPCAAPTADNLLVLYLADRAAVDTVASRLETMGYGSVPPENPYWAGRSVTIPDPDGWRVVLFAGRGLEEAESRKPGAVPERFTGQAQSSDLRRSISRTGSDPTGVTLRTVTPASR